MSHFMFGDFFSDSFDEDHIKIVKKDCIDSGLIIYFDKEIPFCNNIDKMLAENVSCYFTKFLIASDIQKENSQDVLFPYEKYVRDDLFPNGDDRARFNELCDINLQKAKCAIENMIQIFNLKGIRIFVVDGYDIDFKKLNCSLDEMFSDILFQVQKHVSLISTIYEIKIYE